MNAREVGALLGVSPRTVYDLPIPRHKIGRRVVFDEGVVRAYKQSCLCSSISETVAGASRSVELSPAKPFGLRSYFQRRGVAPKPRRSIERKRPAYTGLRLVR